MKTYIATQNRVQKSIEAGNGFPPIQKTITFNIGWFIKLLKNRLFYRSRNYPDLEWRNMSYSYLLTKITTARNRLSLNIKTIDSSTDITRERIEACGEAEAACAEASLLYMMIADKIRIIQGE